MTIEYAELKSMPLKTGSSYVRPVQDFAERVNLSDPATTVMTDLNKVSVVSVRAKTSMDRANAKMIRYGVRMLLVLDDNEQVAGLLTATDVLGEKPMHFLQNMGGTHADIMVRDIMSTQRELQVLKLEDVQKSKVGSIVASLKKANRQHALVVAEGADGRQTVCGLFSITQIARLLGAQVQSFELARTFAEIEAVIACNNLTCPSPK
ncbi:MAG: CBS domain-containing protein [Gallionellaceae bacterium CG1_02_56_997]|nr:MAG: CBS domain-containing protein [Gallionellaceae bacterium CG1_02_56_997]PIV14588.1 MAG: CBS domain-containing protein [Gallionellales bacterium CG03_land_8_20_14_0_80_55_15]